MKKIFAFRHSRKTSEYLKIKEKILNDTRRYRLFPRNDNDIDSRLHKANQMTKDNGIISSV